MSVETEEVGPDKIQVDERSPELVTGMDSSVLRSGSPREKQQHTPYQPIFVDTNIDSEREEENEEAGSSDSDAEQEIYIALGVNTNVNDEVLGTIVLETEAEATIDIRMEDNEGEFQMTTNEGVCNPVQMNHDADCTFRGDENVQENNSDELGNNASTSEYYSNRPRFQNNVFNGSQVVTNHFQDICFLNEFTEHGIVSTVVL